MKIRLKDLISPKRWKFFLIFLLKKLLRVLEPQAKPYIKRYEIEQLVARFLDPDCRKCLDSGNCLHCGCHTEGRMNGWNDSCSAGNWGPIMKKTDWEEYKSKYNLKFKVTYGN